ncbi:MAG TPA: prepilin-type N-terminal cleavage/methylation domain-containing protein [Myxococcaceae bacterium]|nr:prepilin-type N-terminal cleavage/methylation domain-containing protein [Myxococcaceae bacterium]
MRPGVHNRRGFTLLEALVAGAIFFIAVVAISLLSVRGATNASHGLRYAQTARLATQEMERWSMLGFGGLQTATGGVSPFVVPPYPITEQPDGGGKLYNVAVTIVNTAGPAGPPGALPPPELGSVSVSIPSFFVSVQVTSQPPEGGTPVTVSQATYVSPN